MIAVPWFIQARSRAHLTALKDPSAKLECELEFQQVSLVNAQGNGRPLAPAGLELIDLGLRSVVRD
jgi:hypothetical protein